MSGRRLFGTRFCSFVTQPWRCKSDLFSYTRERRSGSRRTDPSELDAVTTRPDPMGTRFNAFSRTDDGRMLEESEMIIVVTVPCTIVKGYFVCVFLKVVHLSIRRPFGSCLYPFSSPSHMQHRSRSRPASVHRPQYRVPLLQDPRSMIAQ